MATKHILNSTELKCTQNIKLYHFVHAILSVPFCPMPFCPYTILSVPFCPLPFCPVTDKSIVIKGRTPGIPLLVPITYLLYTFVLPRGEVTGGNSGDNQRKIALQEKNIGEWMFVSDEKSRGFSRERFHKIITR